MNGHHICCFFSFLFRECQFDFHKEVCLCEWKKGLTFFVVVVLSSRKDKIASIYFVFIFFKCILQYIVQSMFNNLRKKCFWCYYQMCKTLNDKLSKAYLCKWRLEICFTAHYTITGSFNLSQTSLSSHCPHVSELLIP